MDVAHATVLPRGTMGVAGDIALTALDLSAVLAGTARWGRSEHAAALAAPARWRRDIRRILDGERLDQPSVPRRPTSIPTAVPGIAGAPDELGESVAMVLMVLAPLDDQGASDTPIGPLPRPPLLSEDVRRDLTWRTLAAPDSVLADASRGGISFAQLGDLERGLPGVLETWREILGAELARAKGDTPPPHVRRAVAMLQRGEPAAPPPAVEHSSDPVPEGAPRAPGGGGGGGGTGGGDGIELTPAQRAESR